MKQKKNYVPAEKGFIILELMVLIFLTFGAISSLWMLATSARIGDNRERRVQALFLLQRTMAMMERDMEKTMIGKRKDEFYFPEMDFSLKENFEMGIDDAKFPGRHFVVLASSTRLPEKPQHLYLLRITARWKDAKGNQQSLMLSKKAWRDKRDEVEWWLHPWFD